jgi:Zn-dependent M28 family amino/carboxypeptidase
MYLPKPHFSPFYRLCAAVLYAAISVSAAQPEALKPLRPTSDLRKALEVITPDSLGADLSFLSSDALRGRYTPSPGLDIAAEFIASRFRASGLEPGLGNSYFQRADLTEYVRRQNEKENTKPEGPIVGNNVIGILRGSDPKLNQTFIIVSSHYDHIGTRQTARHYTKQAAAADGDEIYNGANDDGSGTVSVIALAEAFSRLKQRPKRSIVFIAFCGEELGLLGSRFYADHPVIPLKQTVANINLEQVGRSDGDIKKSAASLTGFDFTSMDSFFQRAGLAFGVDVYKDKNSDKYFRASDNLSFADRGVPDVTICTAFEFADYHGPKDEWTKIDYAAMVTIDRVVADVLWSIADSRLTPEWNAANPKTETYRKAAAITYGNAPMAAMAQSK